MYLLQVKEEPDCLETLERLKLCEDKSVSRAANGALWKINEEEAHRREKTMGKARNTQSRLAHVYTKVAHSQTLHLTCTLHCDYKGTR